MRLAFRILAAASSLAAMLAVASSSEPAVRTMSWRPLGYWEARVDVVPFDADSTDPPESRPAAVAELARAQAGTDAGGRRKEPGRVWVSFLPGGLELWIVEVEHDEVGVPDDRLFVVRDRATGEISATPTVRDARWIEHEEPRVWLADLDGDGRNEVVIRRFEHNGSMVNADDLEYFAIGDDLSLEPLFEQRTDLADLWSVRDYGSIRSRLLVSGDGRLRATVWRECPHSGRGRVAHGHVDLVRDAAGRYRLGGIVSLLGPDEPEQRYHWTIATAITLAEPPPPRVR